MQVQAECIVSSACANSWIWLPHRRRAGSFEPAPNLNDSTCLSIQVDHTRIDGFLPRGKFLYGSVIGADGV